jgi:uncharacterized cupredoxin-like copper-binding protein
VAVGCAACLVTLAACKDDDNDTSNGGGGGTPVDVTVQEYRVVVDPASAPAGKISFAVYNTGKEMHEFIVFKTDLAPDKLPLKDGKVDEEGTGVDKIGELEEIDPGDTKTLTVTLDAGKHVVICNRVEEGEDGGVESHYVHGMHAAFTAE